MKTQRTRALVAALVMLVAAQAAAAKDIWTSVRSQSFHLVGNAPEKEIRLVATRLEQFRDVFKRLFAQVNFSSPAPTTVVVFKSHGSFKPFKPVADGNNVAVAVYRAGGYAPELAKEMRESLRKAISLRPDFLESYHLLGWINLVTGEELEVSAALLRRALAMAPGNQHYALVLAQIYLRQEKFEQARQTAEPLTRDGALVVREGEGEWLSTHDEGVSYKLLYADAARGAATTPVRMRPGSRIRSHRHLGVEQCLVLEGDVRSGAVAMKSGDFNCSLPGSVHEELVTDGGALLLIVSPERYEPMGPHDHAGT